MVLRAWHSLRRDGMSTTLVRARGRLRWNLHKFHSRLLRREAIRSQFGIWLAPNWNDKTFEYCVRSEAYGRFYSDYLLNFNTTFVMVDIGANQGLYSILAAKNQNCRRVLSYEPVEQTYRYLLRNIELNSACGKVIPVNAALSHSHGTATINLRQNHSGAASLLPLSGTSGTEQVKTLPAHCIEPHLIADLPTLMKVDTEGHEEVIIDMLGRVGLLDRLTSIFYEVDECRNPGSQIERKLRFAGFRHFMKVGSGLHYDILATRSVIPFLSMPWLSY